MKQCKKCGIEKDYSDFGKDKYAKDGLTYRCRDCRNKSHSAYRKTENGQQKIKEYELKNKDKISKRRRERYANNRERELAVNRKWAEQNKDRIREISRKYQQHQRDNTINYKLRCNLKNRIYDAVKNNTKSKRTMELLGCSIEYLKQYLFEQFQDGMSWDNYGEWHIDHIRPCASFDLSDPKQQQACFHYTNLQPLWAIDNLKKQDKW
mgnify:CR=1 FL=1